MRFSVLVCSLLLAACGSDRSPNAATSNGFETAMLAERGEKELNCNQINDHVTLRRCTVLEHDHAVLALNNQFQTTLQRLRQINEEDYASAKGQSFATEEYRKDQEKYVTSLLQSQQAWETYRKEFCNVVRFPGRGGNSNLENFIDCELTLIKARIEQLQALTNELKSDG
jgi:uncharacterized protein YecT (DUF1311 family)